MKTVIMIRKTGKGIYNEKGYNYNFSSIINCYNGN